MTRMQGNTPARRQGERLSIVVQPLSCNIRPPEQTEQHRLAVESCPAATFEEGWGDHALLKSAHASSGPDMPSLEILSQLCFSKDREGSFGSRRKGRLQVVPQAENAAAQHSTHSTRSEQICHYIQNASRIWSSRPNSQLTDPYTLELVLGCMFVSR